MEKVNKRHIIYRVYINYKELKKLIKEARDSNVVKDGYKERELNPEEREDLDLRSPSNSMGSKKGFMKRSENEYNDKFISLLNSELKKVYLFFITKERELYININSHLHLRQTYDTFNIANLSKELEELWKISLTTLNITKFIHLNMIAIKKILKKFDKHLTQYFGNTVSKFIKEKLDSQNSDLVYMLKFKVNYIYIY
jgi:SPX domain protein involved in polyphosphate accumulation